MKQNEERTKQNEERTKQLMISTRFPAPVSLANRALQHYHMHYQCMFLDPMGMEDPVIWPTAAHIDVPSLRL